MIEVLDAVYENGVFKPLKPLDLSNGERVRLTVEAPVQLDPKAMLALAAQIYEGLSDEEIDAIEQIILDRRDFFGERPL